MQIRPIAISNTQPINAKRSQPVDFQNKQDAFACENPFIDKKPLIKRKIISPNQNINEYFDYISSKIFPSSEISRHSFSNLLKSGAITLSSNAYSNLENPKSAIGVSLDPKKTNAQHCAKLEEYLKDGIGVGINFCDFEDPIEKIKFINSYFKYREQDLERPGAGIALLNITHPKILDFISLKDNADYSEWCFDLSVIIDDEFLQKVDNDEDITLDDGTKIPAKKIYMKLLDSMYKSGEPGVIFSNERDFICDSCATAKLQENEGLSLAQINLSKFYNPQAKSLDLNLLSQSVNILALALKNIAPDGFIGILGYQDLLNQMGLNYGSKDAIKVLEDCLKIIKTQGEANGIKTAISPTGTTSRLLKTTPSIEPQNNPNATYWNELDTMAAAQKYLDGGISKTIILKDHHTIFDIDLILRYAKDNNIKGISVFKPR